VRFALTSKAIAVNGDRFKLTVQQKFNFVRQNSEKLKARFHRHEAGFF
jgi:hypothetical protein